LRTRLLIIHNPNAGPAARHLYQATLSRLRRLGGKAEIVETVRRGEGLKAAMNAVASGRFDVVVAAGGDGTVRDAGEGLVGTSMPLGIIPMGMGNVFAREINLPRSPDRLAKTLLEGEVCAIPVGQVNGRPFLFVVGVGFDAEAVRLFEREGTRKLGQAGFAWPVLRALLSYQDRPLRVTSRQGQSEVPWVIVTRAKHYAGNLMLAPEADMHDAQFHVLHIGGSGLINRIRQLSALAVGYVRYDQGVRLETTDRITIDGDRSAPVQIDGEVLGALPLEICIHPKRLRVILPVA
jgi:YegS/Rv2252/BmrU family lipid kinase